MESERMESELNLEEWENNRDSGHSRKTKMNKVI